MSGLTVVYGVRESNPNNLELVSSDEWKSLNDAVVLLNKKYKQAEEDYQREHEEVERLEIRVKELEKLLGGV